MEIKRLNKQDFKNQKYKFDYISDGYYDIKRNEQGFCIEFVKEAEPKYRFFEDNLFADWLDDPIAFGVYEENILMGFIEGNLEKWNKRFRISNILIMKEYRGRGLGSILIVKMEEYAKSTQARMMVLETQSCNHLAIDFYKKNGFDLIGFDLFSYSNEDLEKHEVRFEMGKKLI